MTKDRLHYRLSKKHAHGAEDVERSIGITQSRYESTAAAAADRHRPTALIKWAFDDYVVEEVLPRAALLSSAPADASHPASLVVRVLSEGVPDPVVERQMRERLPRGTRFHFLTPVDVVSCASRYVWLRSADRRAAKQLSSAFSGEQMWHTSAGAVYVSAAQWVPADPAADHFPHHLLPRTRYTVTLRDIQGSLGDVLPQLRSVAKFGCLNYSHVARHGASLQRVYEDAKLLLRREYGGFLHHHVQRLTEGTTHVHREMPLLREVMDSPRSTRREWAGVVAGMEAAVKEDAQVYARAPQIGVYAPHHDLLLDFVRRAADVAPRHHDSAQLVRETVRPLVLQEALHAITDVHFNALASLRWQRDGAAVAIGDVVRVPGAADAPLDVFVGAADHVNGSMVSAAHQDWSAFALPHDDGSGAPAAVAGFTCVATKQEAARYRLSDVVLPTLGRDATRLLAASGASGSKDRNSNSSSAALFAALAQELRVECLPEMRLAPRAAFRSLVQVPDDMSFYLVDEKRGWDWEEDAGAARLKAALYHDQDGVLRHRSPLAERTGKNMVARRGIRDATARTFFLKPARKAGMTCVLQFTLPTGSHATSVIREAFTIATVSPSAIFRLVTATK
ncbi:hypothetical protein NESM_000501100 [Novymonas esmeraldas]|uniref:Uncharacterized protein n=1 Tax=Novymonas esmeraldas TaxID=1808958 RepID=A0AAW0ESR3_9TRYP